MRLRASTRVFDIVNSEIKTSVGISLNVFNRPGTIRTAISGAVNQLVDHNLIVVNDCSTDNTKDVIEKESRYSKFQFINLGKNENIAGSWNEGLKRLNDKWITYTSSDNFQLCNQLSDLVYAGETFDADIVVSPYQNFGKFGTIQTITKVSKELIASGGQGLGPSFIIRKELLDETDLMNPDLLGTEDSALTYDLLLCNPKIHILSKPLYLYRSAEKSTLTFEILRTSGNWKDRSKKMLEYVDNRTKSGINNVRTLITNCNLQGMFPNADIVHTDKFSCGMCYLPGSRQIYVEKQENEYIVKRCPYAKYERGRFKYNKTIVGDILFNVKIPYQCTGERQ
jgi:glycosyltransferase involved in cell wall biosynthesis